MNTKKNKLVLSRETILTLHGDDLNGVNGGATPTTISIASAASVRVSIRFCAQASKYIADKTANISVGVASGVASAKLTNKDK